MLPTNVAVKIDDPDSEFHGDVGFILNNPNSGRIEACDNHDSLKECRDKECDDAEQLPDGWYEIVFDPMESGGFAHCKEWFSEDVLVINGC